VIGDDEPLGIVDDGGSISMVEDTAGRSPEVDAELDFDSDATELASAAAAAAAAVDSPELDLEEPAGKPLAEPELELVGDFEEEEKTAPPTWNEVLQDCLFLARAKGALLIDREGKVTAFCGDWPPPGVEAIATRLVPAMEKALKNAPTRSVSVPLGTQHLTAWRVSLSWGLVTVGFVADIALKPEVRPTIDAELKRGAPA